MIGDDDIRAAVAAGIVTEAQAANLCSLADSRRGARENLAPGDEPFELFRGFNEIFIVVGLLILSSGWVAVNAVIATDQIVDVRAHAMSMAGIAAVVLWLLGAYFIRRRRMVAPAIALTLLFFANAVSGFTAALSQPFMVAQDDYSSLPWPFLLSTLALWAFWWWFRVPFALAIIAIGLFLVAILLAATAAGSPDSPGALFLLSADGPFAWITLALGFAVFVVAMRFDMSDPHRVTRRAANGFWLHLVAAPALVNTLALSLLDAGTALSHATLVLVLAVIALVAIVIDRRSFLMAAVGYSVALALTVLGGDGAPVTILSLGVVLLMLGAFWERIRARLLRLLPFLPLDRLPPSG